MKLPYIEGGGGLFLTETEVPTVYMKVPFCHPLGWMRSLRLMYPRLMVANKEVAKDAFLKYANSQVSEIYAHELGTISIWNRVNMCDNHSMGVYMEERSYKTCRYATVPRRLWGMGKS